MTWKYEEKTWCLTYIIHADARIAGNISTSQTFILSMMAFVPRMLYFFSGFSSACFEAQVVFPLPGRPTIIRIYEKCVQVILYNLASLTSSLIYCFINISHYCNKYCSILQTLKSASTPRTNLAVSFSGGTHCASDSLCQRDILKEREALWLGEERLLLSKVEFHSTVLHQYMWEERTTSKLFSSDAVTGAQQFAILGECDVHFLAAFKVLRKNPSRTKKLDIVNSTFRLYEIYVECDVIIVWMKEIFTM